jgi:aspartate 1-decarboxylase
VTEKNLNYEGSITIDEELLELADIKENELVHVYDINNGNRFETYVIKGKKGSGCIGLNGAAARLVELGDKIIIASYAIYSDEEYTKPKLILLNEHNKPVRII